MKKSSILRAVLLAVSVCVASGAAQAQRGAGPSGGMMGRGSGPMMESQGRMGMFHSSPHIRTQPLLSLGVRWWDEKKAIRKLNLRPEQLQHMDDIFEANRNTLSTLLINLQHEEQRFVDMSREDLRDETKVFAQIDRIAQARADMEKASFHTILQIRAQLDPDQLTELDKEIADNAGQ